MTQQLHTDLSRSIFKTLLYYDIFHYPLTAEEVYNNLQTNHVTADDVSMELKRMIRNKSIFELDKFYSVCEDRSLEARRKKGNALAEQSMGKALERARLISRFPFVRGVMASGSLSKGYMDENSDIDFFIVTGSDRLWIARMLLALFKRLFLRNSTKYFCVNYFLDEHHLEIEEKNLYTATELSTLIPLQGKDYYAKLLAANTWIYDFLPNFRARSVQGINTYKAKPLGKTLEAIFNFFGARQLNSSFMRMTQRRWRKIYQGNLASSDFKIAFKTNEHVSKSHGGNYQRKVIDLYRQKLMAFSLETAR